MLRKVLKESFNVGLECYFATVKITDSYIQGVMATYPRVAIEGFRGR
jgi:hypothetical protein